MLQSQVNYWTLQENKRHNLVSEAIEKEKASYQGMTANASVMQAETGRMLVPAEFTKAEAAKQQAEAAKENVQVNWANAFTNARNADVNEYNARTNRINAAINQQNADINQQNANTNWQNALTNQSNMISNRMVNIATIKNLNADTNLTAQKTDTEAERTKQESINTNFTTANNILNLAGGGAEALKDIATIFKDSSQGANAGADTFMKLLPFFELLY